VLARVLVWTAAAAVALALLVFAVHAYPAPGTDAPSFLVSAIDHHLGRGLVNPFYPQMAFADPGGAQRHVYYPPLFPLVVSALMPRPTPAGAFVAVGALRAASVFLACALLLRVAQGAAPRLDGWTAALVVLALCGLATSWLPTLGRPEALATLLVLVAALGAWGLDGAGLAVFLGVITGLVAATQPFGAVELTAAIGLGFSNREPTRTVLARTATVSAIALAVFAAVLALSPHGLTETLAGMARAYPHTPWANPPGEAWWRPWLTARRSTFYGPLFALAILCGAHLLSRRGGARSRPAFAAFTLVLVACLYHGSLTHDSRRNYNALLLSPLVFAVVVAWFAASLSWTGARWTRPGRAACLAGVAATAIGFLGYLAAFPWFLAHGRGLGAARAAWGTVAFPSGARIVLMGNLWPLSEEYGRMELLSPAALGDVLRRRPVPVVVLGQRAQHRGAPPPLPGFNLLFDSFNREWGRGPAPLRFFLEEDYSFAVYVPVPAAAGGGP
jgi:hypothetical protein